VIAVVDCAEGAVDVADMRLVEHGTLLHLAAQFGERIIGR
jgi:hypothetical protein